MALATMQKANLDQIEADVHGRISKSSAELDGVTVTRVTFGPGARWSEDLKDYAGMNEVFLGRFGAEPGVRTTIAAAGGIPGNSLVEIDCIAYI